MSSSPQRPAPSVAGISDGDGNEGGEQVLDLVVGDRDQPGWCRVAGAFGQDGDDQEGVGKHGQRGLAVPGAPAVDLVLVQATQALASLEGLLDPPAPAGDVDQDGQRGGAGRGAAVAGQLAGPAVAAHQQPVPPGLAHGCHTVVVQAHKRPVVQALALGARAGRDALPRLGRDPPEQLVDPVAGAADGVDPVSRTP
jgi:hypothetical protein